MLCGYYGARAGSGMRLASCHLVVWRLESVVLRPTEASDAPKPAPPAAVCLRVMTDAQSGPCPHLFFGALAGSDTRPASCHIVVWRLVSVVLCSTDASDAPKSTPPAAVCLRVMTDAQSPPHRSIRISFAGIMEHGRGVECGRRRAISLFGAWRASFYAQTSRRMRPPKLTK
jgi:hypothetical protein